MDSKLFWQEDFKIRAYEAGVDGRVSIHSICNYLLEAASNHATHMDVSVEKLFKMNLTWVLSRLHIRMHKFPRWPKSIRIETWPVHKDSFYAIRDFQLFDENGREIGVASSSWMMIDFKARKPVALPEFVDALQNKEKGRSLNDPFDRMPQVKRMDHEKEFHVRQGDLDVNQHVYSVHYLSWGLETIPLDIWKKYRLTDLEINYRAESVYGDYVLSHNQTEYVEPGCSVVHQLRRQSDNREFTRMRTTWQAK